MTDSPDWPHLFPRDWRAAILSRATDPSSLIPQPLEDEPPAEIMCAGCGDQIGTVPGLPGEFYCVECDEDLRGLDPRPNQHEPEF